MTVVGRTIRDMDAKAVFAAIIGNPPARFGVGDRVQLLGGDGSQKMTGFVIRDYADGLPYRLDPEECRYEIRLHDPVEHRGKTVWRVGNETGLDHID